jgi:hypothetical protein
MEVAGLCIAVGALSAKILASTHRSFVRYEDAPEIVKEIRRKLSFITVYTAGIRQIAEDAQSGSTYVTPEQVQILRPCLAGLLDALAEIARDCEKMMGNGKKGRCARLSFAIFDYPRATGLLERLKSWELSLTSVIVLTSL